MSKRFNVYGGFKSFYNEKSNICNDLALVNVQSNNFQKTALYCKDRLITKAQIPFAGVIEHIYQITNVNKNTISISTLYFLKDFNCFGIGTVSVATINSEVVNYNFQGQYIFDIASDVTNADYYGLTLVKRGNEGYVLVPKEDFEYYVYNIPYVSYHIIGNPDEYCCNLETNYKIKAGDYLTNKGGILPLEAFNLRYSSIILGVIINPEFRSFIPFPVYSSDLIYINVTIVGKQFLNSLINSIYNERNGRYVRDAFLKLKDIDKTVTTVGFRIQFTAINMGNSQTLCQMYIPTCYEIADITKNSNITKALNNLGANTYTNIMNNICSCSFKNLITTAASENYDTLNKFNGTTFEDAAASDVNTFIFFGNY